MQHAKKDLDRLDAAFASFNQLASGLTSSIENGKLDAHVTGQQLGQVREEILQTISQWSTEMSEKSRVLVREVTTSHAEQISEVSSFINRGG